jgi:putative ABC transport system ATP-binding protein
MDAAGRTHLTNQESAMPETPQDLILELKSIRKTFFPGTIDQVTALDGIDLNVRRHDFITIIGSNGAGKSTMLNLIAGVFPPERGGRLIINGRDMTNEEEYKHAAHVGRVWQQPSVGTARKLTVEENLSLAVTRGQKRGLRSALNRKRRRLFKDALNALGLGLEDRLNAPVGSLSGGQRQSLALVMATINKPELLLLDEHTGALDPKTAATVLDLTEEIVERERMTTLMVTHNMEMALRFGNRLVMMHKGRILVDMDDTDKRALTIGDLITAFEHAAGEHFADDRILLRADAPRPPDEANV